MPAASPDLAALLEGLREALGNVALEPLADKGLAHHHVRVGGRGVIARCPKQSQMGWSAEANLDYQAACFERAAASGHAPRLHGRLPISARLPRGALLVEEVVGHVARLPHELPLIIDALAAIHSLPMPAPQARAPLLDPSDPLAAMWKEIRAQGAYLEAAGLEAASRAGIDALMVRVHGALARRVRPMRRLTLFDAHPGNFIVRADGCAVLVDLEKARYSYPPLDLAHATLPTSTTWDIETRAMLTPPQVREAYWRWEARVAGGRAWREWIVPLRAAMALWSLTWCAKWRVLSARAASASADGEDWSAAHSATALTEHVRGRVDAYLAPAFIEGIVDELAVLERSVG